MARYCTVKMLSAYLIDRQFRVRVENDLSQFFFPLNVPQSICVCL